MLKNTSLKEFGYNFLGPILSVYTSKLVDKLKPIPGKTKVFHLAREGYALKQAFNIVDENNTSSDYLYVSRTFLFRITLDIESSWSISVKHSFDGLLGEFFKSRYAFTSEQTEAMNSVVEKKLWPTNWNRDFKAQGELQRPCQITAECSWSNVRPVSLFPGRNATCTS